MGEQIFNSLEMDAIGEILNISLGASATAVSTMLDRRVDITVPTVMVASRSEFEFSYMEPAVGVEITYVTGLSGNNIMLLKRQDVKVIVEILMGTEIPEEEFELNEMYLSAICEVMNQMMGSSSTALSELLGEPVNISTPRSFEINSVAEFREKYLQEDEAMVVVRFSLRVENSLESEFLNVMTIDLARKLLSCLGLGDVLSSPEPEPEPAAGVSHTVNIPEPEEEETSNRMMSQDEIEKLLMGIGGQDTPAETPPAVQPAPVQPASVQPAPVQPASVQPAPVQSAPSVQPVPQVSVASANVGNYAMQQFERPDPTPKVISVTPKAEVPAVGIDILGEERAENLDLIMGVPLEISVEIGRTKKFVREILEYNQGALIVLDKLAGDQVDVYVNGQCIAKGDVVVVDDNFGVRITEVLKRLQ